MLRAASRIMHFQIQLNPRAFDYTHNLDHFAPGEDPVQLEPQRVAMVLRRGEMQREFQEWHDFSLPDAAALPPASEGGEAGAVEDEPEDDVEKGEHGDGGRPVLAFQGRERAVIARPSHHFRRY